MEIIKQWSFWNIFSPHALADATHPLGLGGAFNMSPSHPGKIQICHPQYHFNKVSNIAYVAANEMSWSRLEMHQHNFSSMLDYISLIEQSYERLI